ncbi:Csu type fimbrial protein [Ignatzschineria sp. LJL83]
MSRIMMNNTTVLGSIFKRISIISILMLMTMTATLACTVNQNIGMNFGNVTSEDIANYNQETETSSPGLKCKGALVGLLYESDVKMGIYASSSNFSLVNPSGNYTIPYTLYYDKERTMPVQVGDETSLRKIGLLDLLGLFGGRDIDINLYGRIHAMPGHMLNAGRYQDTVSINWRWDICPGVALTPLICIGIPSKGTGQTVLTVELIITEDCRIYADNIDFGTSPFSSTFDAKTGTIRITCTGGVENYTVGLSEGRNFAGTRQMRSGSDTLAYEIYKGDNGGEVWGNQGSARRKSGESDAIVGARSGQSRVFRYKAEVIPGQEDKPVGLYTDDVVIDITF